MVAAPTELPPLDASLAEAMEPPPGPPRWHLRVNGLESGPVTWDVLRRLAGSGELKPTDYVRRTDETRWVPASEARCPEVAARPAAAARPAVVVARRRVVPVARPASRLDEPGASATDPVQPRKPAADASGSFGRGRPDGVHGPPTNRPYNDSVIALKAAEAVAPVPAGTSNAGTASPAARPSPAAGRPAGTALLALGLSLAGLLAFALPLGMLAVYLGGTSAAGLARARGGRLRFAVPLLAVAVGLADLGVSLRVLGGRLCDLGGHVVTAAR